MTSLAPGSGSATEPLHPQDLLPGHDPGSAGSDVHAAHRAYESRREELGRWSPDSVAEFRSAATLADRHYRLGAVTVNVYVEMQRQYLDAVEALLDTRREAITAAGDIETLTGVPLLDLPAATAATEVRR